MRDPYPIQFPYVRLLNPGLTSIALVFSRMVDACLFFCALIKVSLFIKVASMERQKLAL